MKAIPNCLSSSRIIFSLALIFVTPLSFTFYAIYSFCGLSDFLDGFIARKLGSTSKFGARLDSLADFIMTGVLLFLLYPIINPSREIIIWIVFVCIIRFASMFVALKKYKVFAIIHTYGNKFTGILIFIFPFLIFYIHSYLVLYFICFAASVSAIEELVIHLTSKHLELDKKSILIK